ncbi:class F sortase [Herbiconiux sp. L3-i23]|uniref:class F sortase n=1 Tax=Herbiconiux sp. L3-i23 TaxID=2905871 RepID=UPI002046FF7C|nr:class F sortase [Herbiconiux sp. L3-i23]BDI23091.1 hypothetical protein L3i23_18670 [Herbiconiux sp. L3-i23]
MTASRERVAGRHRARWSAARAFGGAERVAAAGIVLVAAIGVVVDGAAIGDAPLLSGPAEIARVDTTAADPDLDLAGSSATTTGASAGLGLASGPQQPIPAQSDSPAPGVVPAHLSIPSIGVDADTSTIGRSADGVLEPPVGLLDAGWFDGSAVPGAVGPAVIAGHVDDTTDAGVFARLHELAPGAEIVVTLTDGSERRFTVDGAVDVAKSAFPTDAVYGPTREPQLRLITCNGPYDYGVMHYSNNLVVFASAA